MHIALNQGSPKIIHVDVGTNNVMTGALEQFHFLASKTSFQDL